MSKELEPIKATIEIPNTKTKTSEYIEREVDLTSFFGGSERGHSLQLGFMNEKGFYSFIQIDNEQVKQLIKELVKTYL